MNRVRIGAVGTGGIFYGWGGTSGHLPAYPRIDEAKVVALCDTSEVALQRAEYMLKKIFHQHAKAAEERGDTDAANRLREDANGVKCYTQIKEMLENEELELVDITSPPISHVSIAVEALKSGVNVMCEKPMARTWLECQEIVEAVAESGKLYQHNENLIYDYSWYGLRKFLDSGVIGEPLTVFLSMAIGDAKSIRWNANMSGGGALIDMGIHAITTIWFALGFDRKCPTKVKATEPHGIGIKMPKRLVKGVYQNVHVEDDAHIMVEFEDQGTGSWTTVHIEASWSYQDSRGGVIIGTNGSIENIGGESLKLIDPFGNSRQVQIGGPRHDMTEVAVEGYSGYLGEIRNMCNCVINGIKPMCDEKIGAESQAVVDAAYLSQLRGQKAVSLEEYKEYAKELKKMEGSKVSDVLISNFMSTMGRN